MQSTKSASKVTLGLLAFIMVVNALSYGTIIPLLYPYSMRFGLNELGLGLMFASFSLAQFIATPIIGRLSDKYGRKPLLLFCLFGTSLSLALFASATNVVMLFVARILDGITGGNNSVAQAIIADSTKGPERAKAFGILGAAFGIGFLAGPALGGVVSQFGLTAPFWLAAILAFIGTLLGVVLLPETLEPHKRQESNKPFFDLKSMAAALFSPSVGLILFITLLVATSQNAFVIGFQAFTNTTLKLDATTIGFIFAAFGLVSVIMQAGGVRLILNAVPSKKKIISISLFASAAMIMAMTFQTTLPPFMVLILAYTVAFASIFPVLTALLSERTKAEDQGGMLGISQSYLSLGQIIGPLLAGAVATNFGVPLVFVLAAVLSALALLASRYLYIPKPKLTDL
jgi:multidrug resistance protein